MFLLRFCCSRHGTYRPKLNFCLSEMKRKYVFAFVHIPYRPRPSHPLLIRIRLLFKKESEKNTSRGSDSLSNIHNAGKYRIDDNRYRGTTVRWEAGALKLNLWRPRKLFWFSLPLTASVVTDCGLPFQGNFHFHHARKGTIVDFAFFFASFSVSV